MHLLFVDESGTPPKPTAKNPRPYFVIAGLVMHEDQWHPVCSELKTLCSRPEYAVQGEIKWRYFGANNTDPDNSVGHLDARQRDAFREDLYNLILRRKSIKVLACVTSVSAAYSTPYVSGPEDIYRFSYKVLSERFQYHLQDLSRTVGSKQHGIVIADHRGKKQDEELRKEHIKFVDDENHFSSTYQNFIEGLMLTPSHMSPGIQLADMVAGAVGRAFNTRSYTNPDTRFVDQLEPSFRKSPEGKIEGWGLIKFPKGSWR